jgi:hypothetical protein
MNRPKKTQNQKLTSSTFFFWSSIPTNQILSSHKKHFKKCAIWEHKKNTPFWALSKTSTNNATNKKMHEKYTKSTQL